MYQKYGFGDSFLLLLKAGRVQRVDYQSVLCYAPLRLKKSRCVPLCDIINGFPFLLSQIRMLSGIIKWKQLNVGFSVTPPGEGVLHLHKAVISVKFLHSFVCLDFFKASSTQIAIYCFPFHFSVPSCFLKIIQYLLTSLSSSSRHFYPIFYLFFNNVFQNAVPT